MARKSRKNTMDVATVVQDHTAQAAIYIRLSVEDKHTGSISIETQRMIIGAKPGDHRL